MATANKPNSNRRSDWPTRKSDGNNGQPASGFPIRSIRAEKLIKNRSAIEEQVNCVGAESKSQAGEIGRRRGEAKVTIKDKLLKIKPARSGVSKIGIC